MIEKPKQYFDTRSHQLYYQWDESEYFSHQEPIYDRTREYIESLEAENAKLRELAQNLRRVTPPDVVGVVIGANTDHPSYYKFDKAFQELGIEVGK